MKEDFFEKIRDNMIETMQKSLKNIRFIIGVSSQELGNFIGVSKQTIENLEQNLDVMTGTQYLALSAVLDMKVKENPAIKNNLLIALRGPEQQFVDDEKVKEDSLFSFVDKWFMTFQTKEIAELSNEESLDFYTMTMIANNYKIFINYDSLMIGRENKMFLELLQLMKESNNSLIVPTRVVDRLQSYIFSSDATKREDAKRALTFLNTLHENDNIVLKGNEKDGTIFEVMNKVFSSFKLTTKLVLITQDKELSRNLLCLNSQLKGFPIKILELKDEDKIKIYRNKSISNLVETKLQDAKINNAEFQEIKEIAPYSAENSVNYSDDDDFYYDDDFSHDGENSTVSPGYESMLEEDFKVQAVYDVGDNKKSHIDTGLKPSNGILPANYEDSSDNLDTELSDDWKLK